MPLFLLAVVIPALLTDLVVWSVAWWAGVVYTLWLLAWANAARRAARGPYGI